MFELLARRDYVLSLTLATESDRSERLLMNVLPVSIIQQLKEIQDDQVKQSGGEATEEDTSLTHQMAMGFAEAYEHVSILFSDVVGFTKIGSDIEPEELVQLLNELFTMFDDIAEECGLEKIKTIGDAYMAAAGLPRYNPMHAHATARMGLMMIEDPSKIEDGNLVDQLGHPLRIRVGIHSGHCVAGVIGRKKFIYDVWGDCVNTASRMESHGTEMRVHCSEDTANLVRHSFDLTCRGVMEVKGKGLMTTYYINKERRASRKRDYRNEYGGTMQLSHGMVSDVEEESSDSSYHSSASSCDGEAWNAYEPSCRSADVSSLNTDEIGAVGMTRRRLSSVQSGYSPSNVETIPQRIARF
ncbi:conserved hypothetical protein [Perkinsus marinus ATCC 50983]|uniref:Guanylate cyclase domain-containing protein n=1 Tax=Perkinsus marinus (strain ATCC 50983 / TXsc) TaxID=423536 RepID=C5KX18_PERM5|nr:conserved hypothetical protein [Perkinsus marinus ATCC 50983]EER11022.1 conserved hypothetical protein [Perkinsus marinus ATCC 50983]|eukprot:XP_002779227.1 conserved hypothetical protein [Perkinsus marinus ATCC 50983]